MLIEDKDNGWEKVHNLLRMLLLSQMSSQIIFLTKVIILSVVLSLLIKYVAPWFALTGNTINALLSISLPSIIMGALLWWRAKQWVAK